MALWWRPTVSPDPMSHAEHEQQELQAGGCPHPYPAHHERPLIVVHRHDVLCGRGVNIAEHPGNERFRALVNSRQDDSYCTFYTTSEKRAVAEDIIKHIKSLDPPGRFLRRSGRAKNSRGLNGPWEELSDRESIKKTCQALRDCNRSDRKGYAAAVAMPEDVQRNVESRNASGLTNKQYAAASAVAAAAAQGMLPRSESRSSVLSRAESHSGSLSQSSAGTSQKRSRIDFAEDQQRLSPSVENAAEWLKKQRTDDIPPCVVANLSVPPAGGMMPPNRPGNIPSPATVTVVGSGGGFHHHDVMHQIHSPTFNDPHAVVSAPFPSDMLHATDGYQGCLSGQVGVGHPQQPVLHHHHHHHHHLHQQHLSPSDLEVNAPAHEQSDHSHHIGIVHPAAETGGPVNDHNGNGAPFAPIPLNF